MSTHSEDPDTRTFTSDKKINRVSGMKCMGTEQLPIISS